MSTTLIELISTERQRYYDIFSELSQAEKEGKSEFATELGLQMDIEEIPEPFNTYRADCVWIDENGEYALSEIRPEANPDYEPLEFRLDSLTITTNPFCWNSCEITVDNIEIEELGQWLIKWLRIDEEEEDVLADAVHSCSYPEQTDNGFRFIIDFGTAPPDAFTELLQVLIDSAATTATFETLEI
jgi:hypothetical protein